ncbi:MAG: hypothetical protein LBR12_06135 [Opitutaceae bacterium]|jgi:tetratricopeptide (TPR) repeat protein|nr:hypothetical protein [Opitutaceae bacterium]
MKLTNEKSVARWVVLPALWLSLGFFLALHCVKTLEYYDRAGEAGQSSFPKTEIHDPEGRLLVDPAGRPVLKPVLTTPLQLIWPSFAMDGKTWTRYALTVSEGFQEVDAAGKPRVDAAGKPVRVEQTRLRRVNIDNALDGRKVYWNSTWALLMAKGGELRAKWFGEPLPLATERWARWQNLPVFTLIIVIFTIWVARRAGVGAAVFTGFAMAGIPSFYEGFLPAYPDHHGLSTVATFGVVIGALFMGAGWWRAAVPGEPPGSRLLPKSPAQARGAAVFSALSGVFGMWITAAPALPPIAIVGTMGLFVSFFHNQSLVGSGAQFDPKVWRLWGRIGAVGSLIAYLLEFFPSYTLFSPGCFRLEVNNPLYSLAWFLAGEYIAGTIELWQTRFKAGLENSQWLRRLLRLEKQAAAAPLEDGDAATLPAERLADRPSAAPSFAGLILDWFQRVLIYAGFMAAPWAFAFAKGNLKTAARLAACVLFAVIPVPLIIALFGTDVFVIRDTFLADLHKKIAEFQHVWEHSRLANPYIRATLFMYSGLPVAVLLLFLAFKRRRRPFLIVTGTIAALHVLGGLFATFLPAATNALLQWLPSIQKDLLLAGTAETPIPIGMNLPLTAIVLATLALALLVFAIITLVLGLRHRERRLVIVSGAVLAAYGVAAVVLAAAPAVANPVLAAIPGFKESIAAASVNAPDAPLWQLLWANVRWGFLELAQFFLAMPFVGFPTYNASAWLVTLLSLVSLAGIVVLPWFFDWKAVDAVVNRDKAVITLVFVTTGIIVFMGLWQMRWLLNASGPQICIFLFLAAALLVGKRDAFRWLFIASLVGAFFVPRMLPSITRINEQLERRSIEKGDAAQCLYRDVARAVRATQPEGDIVMLASPNASTEVGYYGRFKTIGTLYWENNTGLHTAAEMYSEENDDKALKLLVKHGVTHIVIISEENFLVPYYQLLHPAATQQDVLRSLGIRLFVTKNFPVWVRPIPYEIPPDLKPLEFTVAIFQIVPNQTLPEAFYHLGVAQVSLNQHRQANESFDNVIKMAPNAVEPWIRKAEIQLIEAQRAASQNIAQAQQNLAEAQRLYEQAIARVPEDVRVAQYNQAAAIFYQRQAYLQAADLYKKALAWRFAPDTAANYAWLLSTNKNPLIRDARLSLELTQKALDADPDNPLYLAVRAAALAENGDFPAAVSFAERAAQKFRAGGNENLARQSEARAALFRQNQPVRE